MTRTLDLRIKSSGAIRKSQLKQCVRRCKKHCAMDCAMSGSVTSCNAAFENQQDMSVSIQSLSEHSVQFALAS